MPGHRQDTDVSALIARALELGDLGPDLFETDDQYRLAVSRMLPALADALEAVTAQRDTAEAKLQTIRDNIDSEEWWVGGAWGDYGEPVVLERNVLEWMGEDFARDRDDRSSDYAANYREAHEAAELAEEERDEARAERDTARAAIQDAPHETTCRARAYEVMTEPWLCNCWKSRALAALSSSTGGA